MIVYVRYGTRLSGKVDSFAGSYVATRFFHIYYVPLIPLSSWLVLGEDGASTRALPTTLDVRSIAAAYLRGVGSIAALVMTFQMFAFFSSPFRSLSWENFVPELVLPLALIVAAVASWVWLGRLSRDERGKRVVYWDSVGYFVDPARLGDARHGLIEKLRKDVVARARALTSAGYREPYDPENKWRALAAKPSMTDVEYLKLALTLSRLEWSFASGEHKTQLARDHQLIFENLKRADPNALSPHKYAVK
ncbi:MAG TPA: hypothetical protein VFF06_04135 [Polyangia bacterium]|nr:hypothetical protein [Polyangia bacterium]